MNAESLAPRDDVSRIQKFLLALLAAEMLGIGAELALVAHWEGPWQIVPLALVGIGTISLIWMAIARNPWSRRAFKTVMVLFVLAGCVGIWLHYDGRAEFRQELNPSLEGWDLFKAAMTGSSTPPVLAPGVMMQMGFLGLISVFQHRTAIAGDAA